MEAGMDLAPVAFETTGYTGAQLANLVNTAAGFVVKAGRDVIAEADLMYVRPPHSPPCHGGGHKIIRAVLN